MSKIVMYGTPTCGDCILAKHVFAEKNIEYENGFLMAKTNNQPTIDAFEHMQGSLYNLSMEENFS